MDTKRLDMIMKERRLVKLFVLMECDTCSFNIEAEVRNINDKLFCPICKSSKGGVMHATHIIDFKEL